MLVWPRPLNHVTLWFGSGPRTVTNRECRPPPVIQLFHPRETLQLQNHPQSHFADRRKTASPLSLTLLELPAMSGVLSGIYATFVRRNYVFVSTIFVAAFGTEILFDTGANALWDQINRGRQWKDIKHRYLEAAEDEEE